MQQNKIIVPIVPVVPIVPKIVPKIVVPSPGTANLEQRIREMQQRQEETIRMLEEIRTREEEQYQKIIQEQKQEHQNMMRQMVQEQQNIMRQTAEQYQNNMMEMIRAQQEETARVHRELEEIRKAVVPVAEEREEEEEISTTGGKVVTKERGERLSEEEIKILLNRIGKNMTTYQQKYKGGEREEQIRRMRETQRILREIQEEKRKVKRGAIIKG